MNQLSPKVFYYWG